MNHSTHNMNLNNPDKTLVRFPGNDTTNGRHLHVWDKQPVRLYDVIKDPHEKNELSSSNPEVVARLKKRIETWHAATSTIK